MISAATTSLCQIWAKWRLPLISMEIWVIFVVWLLINWLVNVTETFRDILNIMFFKRSSYVCKVYVVKNQRQSPGCEITNFYFHFVVFTLEHEVKKIDEIRYEAPDSPIRRTIVSIIATAARYQDMAMCRLCGWIITYSQRYLFILDQLNWTIEFFFKFWNRFTSQMVWYDWPLD